MQTARDEGPATSQPKPDGADDWIFCFANVPNARSLKDCMHSRCVAQGTGLAFGPLAFSPGWQVSDPLRVGWAGAVAF